MQPDAVPLGSYLRKAFVFFFSCDLCEMGATLYVVAALFLLYDVTNRKSFDNTRAWLAEINEYAHRDVIIMLLGILDTMQF